MNIKFFIIIKTNPFFIFRRPQTKKLSTFTLLINVLIIPFIAAIDIFKIILNQDPPSIVTTSSHY